MQPVILALLGRLDLEPKTLLSKLTVHMNETLTCVLAFAQRIGRSSADNDNGNSDEDTGN